MTFTDRALNGITAISAAVKQIGEAYAKLPALIAQEHEAIVAGNLDQVELVAAAKLSAAATIERSVAGLRKTCKEFQDLASEHIAVKAEFTDLSANFTLIQSLLAIWSEQGHDIHLVEATYKILVNEFETFLQVKDDIATQLEVNRMVLARLLANRQENYRFWQEVTADTMAAYNKGGKQKAARSSSTLKIKA